jgi:ACS family hexuronate transporter-like MFS transporter
MAISLLDRQTLAVLAPTVTAQLHISDAAYGWLGSAFSMAYLAGAPLAGWLIDRVGARRGMLGAMVLWTIVAALHAIAPGFAALFALRLALGLAESPSYPAAVQTVRSALAPADLPRGMSTLFVGMSLGAMLVPPLAVWLQSRWGWRAAFGVTAGVGLLWIPIWLRVAFTPRARAVLDSARAMRVPLGEVIAHPDVVRALLALVAVTPCTVLAMTWESKLYTTQLGLKPADVWSYMMASAFAYDCGALLFGDLAARRARALRGSAHDGSAPRALFGIGTALAAIGVLALSQTTSPHVAVACFVASAVGRGALVTLLNSDMASRAPRAAVSTAAGIIASAQAGVHALVNPIIGHSVQAHGYRGILLALGVWTIPGSIAWMVWSPRAPQGLGSAAP